MDTKLIALATLILLLTGCADSVSTDSVGFLHGLWHGMILPISFVVSLFDDGTVIYAAYNTGGWYDLGFLLGVGTLSSSY